jgi:hypothetical protein
MWPEDETSHTVYGTVPYTVLHSVEWYPAGRLLASHDIDFLFFGKFFGKFSRVEFGIFYFLLLNEMTPSRRTNDTVPTGGVVACCLLALRRIRAVSVKVCHTTVAYI